MTKTATPPLTNQKPLHPEPQEAQRLRQNRVALLAAAELARRGCESLALYVPFAKQLAAHKSQARRRLVYGSNRAGKTLFGAAEFAWAVSGSHPWLSYPKENGICYCVAMDQTTIGEVMWSKVALKSPFRIIRDHDTRKWRVWDPTQPWDQAYKEKSKEAPPLLSRRFWSPKDVSWESEKEQIPKLLKLKNGWHVRFFPSGAEPLRGSEIDMYWLDEEIRNSLWVPELAARAVQRQGRGIWTATPQSATQQMLDWHNSAMETEGDDPEIEEFFLHIEDNPYLSAAQRAEFLAQLSESERDVRYDGNWSILGLRVYPQFNTAATVKSSFTPPDHWTRYMWVDPGYARCAVTFYAVPPPDDPEWGGTVHIHQELVISQCTAALFAEKVAALMGSEKAGKYRLFGMDMHWGRQHHSSDDSIADQYSEALAKMGVWSSQTKSHFVEGCDDIEAREGKLRSWLELNPESKRPTLIVHANCRELINEFRKVTYRVVNGKNRRTGRGNDLVSSAEYAAHWGCPYVPRSVSQNQAAMRIPPFMERLRRVQANKSVSLRFSPPSIGVPHG